MYTYQNPAFLTKSEVYRLIFSNRDKLTLGEVRKIKNTLIGENPNKMADDFVNLLRNEKRNRNGNLEIVWLTTNVVRDSVVETVQEDLNSWKRENDWSMNIEFIPIDKHALDSVIYDVEHGYIPYTGKKLLKLEAGNWMETDWQETGLYSVICNVNVNDILKWFFSTKDIDNFLQKNVREFLGEASKINKEIGKSYANDPMWFWYKHNGVIIFADNVRIDSSRMQLVLRNPQIVNGGQTLKSLFSRFLRSNRKDNGAKVLLRVFRFPYEDTKTYKRSIDIIGALNTQNKIKASDLRSTDPRQVGLERLFKEFGYRYLRKRSKEAKSSTYSVTMTNLALRYYVCKKNAPQEGVRGNVEELFEEEKKYSDIFNETAINSDLSDNHIVFNFATCWRIDQILVKDTKKNLLKRDIEYFRYTRWYVLSDCYSKVMEWKKDNFDMGWQAWTDFIDSPRFRKVITDYSRTAFKVGREIIPKHDEPSIFFKTKQAVNKFSSKVTKRDFLASINKGFKMFLNEY